MTDVAAQVDRRGESPTTLSMFTRAACPIDIKKRSNKIKTFINAFVTKFLANVCNRWITNVDC